MKRAEVLALSDALRRVLAAIEAGELVASQATVYSLQGAVVALAPTGTRGVPLFDP